MDPLRLKQFIHFDEELSPHTEYLNSITKPCIDITFSLDEAKDGDSRFGGTPLVPKDFVWPTHQDGEYRFLGQINFSDISQVTGELPTSGLLSLFYAYDEEGEVFWGDDGYVLGYFYRETNDLSLYAQPIKSSAAKKITFVPGIEIPRHEDLRQDWPFDTDALYGLSELEGYCEDYMLGYPSFNTLAYDPTPAEDWISLLTITSYDEFEWCWHDGDKLMIFIEKEKLKKADFSYLKTDAG